MFSIFGNRPKKRGREKQERPYSHYLTKAYNATRGGRYPITMQCDLDGEERILVRGKFSPAVDALVAEVGLEEAWDELIGLGIAYGVPSDRAVRSLR